MVEVGTGGVSSRFIKTDWPNEEGLIAGTTRQTGERSLHPQEDSLVPERVKKLL